MSYYRASALAGGGNAPLERENAVRELGGGAVAAKKLRSYMESSLWLASSKSAAGELLVECGDVGIDELIDILRT